MNNVKANLLFVIIVVLQGIFFNILLTPKQDRSKDFYLY